ncbi:hypothetical protein SERLA73DRAFT_158160 [Serpula lacrymans var. lacrymans S7.3]|uniref:Uncharacterized protein n=1 Tax=Serpula lacrymans var. lacrymans (strain S7.3) TaxID=936435 RepID=F8PKL6_SERL3|nr:hypothetical protein SERLA73DRAFT_158160 [Serpula lacrymans var. lacrymans S7.3]
MIGEDERKYLSLLPSRQEHPPPTSQANAEVLELKFEGINSPEAFRLLLPLRNYTSADNGLATYVPPTVTETAGGENKRRKVKNQTPMNPLRIDILKAKLTSGIQLGHYIVSYGNRPNDFESASRYLQKKFAALLKDHSPERPFYCHFTSVTDTKSTIIILENVQDMIVRDNLKKSALVA